MNSVTVAIEEKNQRRSDLATAPAGRRLMAAVYDALPVFAVAFVASLAVVRLMPGDHVPAGTPWFRLYLLLAVALYYLPSWVRGGQTLGTRAWNLAVVSTTGEPLNWGRAALRYSVAVLGWLPLAAGHWWFLVDAQGRNWHDRAAGTRVVLRRR